MHHLHTQNKHPAIFICCPVFSAVCPPSCLYCTLMISLPCELLEQVKQQHHGVKLKYLAEYCFSGTYILTLLTEGYNFTSESYSNIKFIKKVSRSRSTPFLSHTPLSVNTLCLCECKRALKLISLRELFLVVDLPICLDLDLKI